MFVYLFIVYSILYVSEGIDILNVLWDENYPVSEAVRGRKVSDNDANMIANRLSQVPFTNMLKFDFWSKLSQQYEVENFSAKDWKRFEALLPHLPLSFFEKVNVTDNSIISYFGQVKLRKPQLARLAEEVMLQNESIFHDEEKLQSLGNIICGFTERKLSAIKDPVLRSLMKKNFFQRINCGDTERLKDLLKRVGSHTVAGPPRTWHPETVKQAGNLISGLSESEIREIRDRSFSQISSEVIEFIPVEILKAVTDNQLKALSRSALLSWRRKTRDLRYIYRDSGCSLKISLSIAVLAVFLSQLNRSYALRE